MPSKSGSRNDKAPNPAPAVAPADFEAALGRLEEIVTRLERGDITLDESLSAFQEGSGLVRYCLDRLNQAETTVQELMKGEAGAPAVREARPGLEGSDDEEA